jgi:hypothetical protein
VAGSSPAATADSGKERQHGQKIVYIKGASLFKVTMLEVASRGSTVVGHKTDHEVKGSNQASVYSVNQRLWRSLFFKYWP